MLEDLTLNNCVMIFELVANRLDTLDVVDREDRKDRTELAHIGAKLNRRIIEMRAGTGRSR